ncbi:integrase-like protein [Kribbella sp. VKM Ac-2527]|uniref:Integrase-like protein n=1 Tax=Kribbella caucasensis TaxID=2512215 RepID=A0A4V3C9X4_9ACTN|nr:integrase-like protein [Kribbella sp. VKM Ac-2527]
MIDDAITELTPLVGTRKACAAAGRAQANHYRRHRKSPAPARPPREPKPQPRALGAAERAEVRAALNSEEHVDKAPAAVYHELLDNGVYLASISTMYRILRDHDEVHERRRHAVHPARVKPELVATKPNMCWSWDITKLHGPAKWSYYYLYVIIDIYSRYVVGWLIAEHESAALAEKLLADTITKHGIEADQLTLHADNGSSMASKPVAFLLADLGVTKTHSRPHTSNDNPYSEAQLPGSGQESHLPAPTDPDVNLSIHPARAVQPSGQYRSSQCANSRGARSRTAFNHCRAFLSLRLNRSYFHCAQRIRWRSMRSQRGFTLLG